MSSERKIAANRANAAKSTGPVTPEGKQKVSRNAVNHGLLAASIVLEGESVERFAALLAGLKKAFEPEDYIESALIENMAVARWRQMRLWGMECAHMSYEIEKQEAVLDNEDILGRDARTRASIACRTLSDGSHLLDYFNRCEARLDRQFARAFDRLAAIREKRKMTKQSQMDFVRDDPHGHA